MSESKARGYILSTTVAYLQEQAGEEKARQVIGTLSPTLQDAISRVAPAGWYPIALLSELNRALVGALAPNDEAAAREMLLNCGRFMGREATNTFLKLLMRMLTPNLFAKKLPDVWKRDFTAGRLEIDVTEGRLVCRIFDASGHDHIGPISAGYIEFALKAMGKTIESTILHKWSLAEPNVDGVCIEYMWKT